MSTYTSSSLTFYSNKIVCEDTGSTLFGEEVMMDWEHPIMSSSAAYVTQNGGDILEIGFGMGIASGYIQSHSISSHIIIENHPQIISKAIEWASGKSNVTIISQSWSDVTGSLGNYDGIFYDTFGDYESSKFGTTVESLTKSGTKVTWWNNLATQSNIHNIDDVTYERLSVTPEINKYYNYSYYYLPKKEF
jgi:protein arginine N-methyltransferase 2